MCGFVIHIKKKLSSRGAKKICRKKILGAQVWWWNSVEWNLKGRMEAAPVIWAPSKSKRNWGATQNSDQFLNSMQDGANWGTQVCWWIRLNWIWREKWQLPAPVIFEFLRRVIIRRELSQNGKPNPRPINLLSNSMQNERQLGLSSNSLRRLVIGIEEVQSDERGGSWM